MPKVLEISNWLYNAGVTGFLEVLKEAYDLTDEQVLGMIQDDGERIVIPDAEYSHEEGLLKSFD